MGNNYFQFKQFRINQDDVSMRVSTEGCLLGALVQCDQRSAVLDIGAGTGLLALMIAQRTGGLITSIEVDDKSARQALANIQASPWSSRVTLVNDSIQHFASTCADTFDVIVSNPPFYTNYLPTDDIRRKLAMHTYSLSMEDLATVVSQLMSSQGVFYVLYPAYEAGLFAQTARRHGLFPAENHVVRNKADGPIFRMITSYKKERGSTKQSELVIRDEDNQYTADFATLLQPYYLNL